MQNYTHALYYDTIAHHTRLGTNPLQTARALTIFCLYPTLWYCQNLLWKPLKRNRLDLAPRKKEEDQQQNEPTNGPYKLESHYYNCIENCVRLCCAFYQLRQTVQKCWAKTILLSQTGMF